MASPSFSATLNFVKKYPIVLCGFSLLFMPSVQRLLLYFTPLLLSTAIFIVAMMSWGPSTSTERGRGRSSKHRVGHAWAFNKLDEEEEEEDEEEVEEEESYMQQEEVSQKGNPIKDMQQEVISQKGNPITDMPHEEISQKGKPSNAEPDPDLKLEAAELEPADPDLAEEGDRVGGQAEPDPDSQRDCAGTTSTCGSPLPRLGGQAEPDPDLQRDCVGTASYSASAGLHAEPDPDLHAEQKAESDLHLCNFPAGEHEHDPRPADHPAGEHEHDPRPADHPAAADLHAQPAQVKHDQPAASHRQDDQHAEESADDNAGSIEGDMQHEAALRHELGEPYTAASDDPHDMELARAAVERLEARLGISGTSGSSHQRAPEYRLQALHAAA